MARKGLYESKVLPRLAEIEEWARDGFTDKEIAARLLVSENSFAAYKNEHEELREALENSVALDALLLLERINLYIKNIIVYVKCVVLLSIETEVDYSLQSLDLPFVPENVKMKHRN